MPPRENNYTDLIPKLAEAERMVELTERVFAEASECVIRAKQIRSARQAAMRDVIERDCQRFKGGPSD